IHFDPVSRPNTHSSMTRASFFSMPGLAEQLSVQNPMGRFGRMDELRCIALCLASDASTFCTGTESFVAG
ncbi:hypothetical protein B0H19DRAFT_894040, partial [Mycena capillaripes]